MRTRAAPRARGFGVEGLLLAAALTLLAVPWLLEARAALEWTRHHSGRGATAARPGPHLREAGRWAARAIDLSAPLPTAATAAGLALGLASAVGERDQPAALALCTELRGALERVRASPGRGLGLATALAGARRCEDERAEGR